MNKDVHSEFVLDDIRITGLAFPDAVSLVRDAAQSGKGFDVHLCNAYTFACASADRDLGALLGRASLNLPDGMAVTVAARLLGGRTRGRVPGPDLMPAMLAEDADLRHYFLGSTPETLRRVIDNVRARYPHAVIAGFESPPFRALTEEEQLEQLERVRASGANVVWIGLGTPKQDVETARIAESIPAAVIAIGAAFDFFAGTLARAPRWMQRSGLEWTFRLAQEPRRLWRRYLFGNLTFFKLVFAQLRDPNRGARLQ